MFPWRVARFCMKRFVSDFKDESGFNNNGNVII